MVRAKSAWRVAILASFVATVAARPVWWIVSPASYCHAHFHSIEENSADLDPWTTPWITDADGVYSAGPNRTDDAGVGDDIRMSVVSVQSWHTLLWRRAFLAQFALLLLGCYAASSALPSAKRLSVEFVLIGVVGLPATATVLVLFSANPGVSSVVGPSAPAERNLPYSEAATICFPLMLGLIWLRLERRIAFLNLRSSLEDDTVDRGSAP